MAIVSVRILVDNSIPADEQIRPNSVDEWIILIVGDVARHGWHRCLDSEGYPKFLTMVEVDYG